MKGKVEASNRYHTPLLCSYHKFKNREEAVSFAKSLIQPNNPHGAYYVYITFNSKSPKWKGIFARYSKEEGEIKVD